MSDPPKPSGPPASSSAFAVVELLRQAMTTTYGMIARETLAGFEAAASLEAVLELLIAKGLITTEELAAAREKAAARIAGERAEDWRGPWLTIASEEERARPAEQVDCEARHASCEAACCSFYRVVLTEDEVRQGRLLWDLGAPYSLPRGKDGHCVNLDRATLKCAVWRDRPHVCRGYSCANDKQIWDDFHAMVPTERVRAMSRNRSQHKAPNDE